MASGQLNVQTTHLPASPNVTKNRITSIISMEEILNTVRSHCSSRCDSELTKHSQEADSEAITRIHKAEPKGDTQALCWVSVCFLGMVERPLLGDWDVNFQDRVCWEGHCRGWRGLEGQPDGKRDERPSASLISCVSTILSFLSFLGCTGPVAHGLSLVVVQA